MRAFYAFQRALPCIAVWGALCIPGTGKHDTTTVWYASNGLVGQQYSNSESATLTVWQPCHTDGPKASITVSTRPSMVAPKGTFSCLPVQGLQLPLASTGPYVMKLTDLPCCCTQTWLIEPLATTLKPSSSTLRNSAQQAHANQAIIVSMRTTAQTCLTSRKKMHTKRQFFSVIL